MLQNFNEKKGKKVMPMQLDNINFELQRELELANNRLAIAIEGLRVISDNADPQRIAYKTLKEIDAI